MMRDEMVEMGGVVCLFDGAPGSSVGGSVVSSAKDEMP